MTHFILTLLTLIVFVWQLIFYSLNHFPKGPSLDSCPLSYPGLERSFFVNTPKHEIKDIPDNLVLEYLDSHCELNRLTHGVFTGQVTLKEYALAQREFLTISDKLGEYLYRYPRPKLPSPYDLILWVFLANTHSNGQFRVDGHIQVLSGHNFLVKKNCHHQVWADCQLLQITQFRSRGSHMWRRIFNYHGFLLTDWESIGA